MTQDPQLVVITHGYTDSNKGDVGIALGTVTALRQALPGASLISHSNYSEAHVDFGTHTRMMAREGIPVVEGVLPSPYLDDEGAGSRRDAVAMLRLAYELFCLGVLWFLPGLVRLHPRKARALAQIRRARLIVARGGQYLHNESGRIRGTIYLARMLLNLAVPIWLHRPTVILGLSIGPIHGAVARRLLTATLRPCRAIFVRERRSAEFLQTRGLGATVRVVPDLAFLTTSTRTEASRVPERGWIGVTLVNWSFPGNRQPQEARGAYLEAVFRTLVRCHDVFALAPLLVHQVTVSHHGRHDRSIQDEMVERLRAHQVPAEHVTGDLTPGELCDVFGQCRLVLASRLHTVILAACAGTPAVAIRYQGYKTQGIMEMLGAPMATHNIDQLSVDDLLESIHLVMAQQERLRTELREKVAGLRRQIFGAVEEIAAMIQPPADGLVS
ncbi:MAG: polysaccharide pyruvyl transferase [Anaerolineales bacterium]|nr:polysaccharide pyruvyl transferase [Anaerolineales bacterium]